MKTVHTFLNCEVANSNCTGMGPDRFREQDWHDRTQWILVPVRVSDQSEHFIVVLHVYFPFDPSPVPVQYEYTINLIFMQTALPNNRD